MDKFDKDDSMEIKTMRYMEWERVKGGLRAILVSYWCPLGATEPDKEHVALTTLAEKFMQEFGEQSGID